MGQDRSTSSVKYNKKNNNKRARLRAKQKRPNHQHRGELRATCFKSIREELSKTLGIPEDCRIYFLKKHDLNNLPNKPRLRITFGNSALLDADTWKVLQVNRFTPFSEMSQDHREEMEFSVKTIYEHTLARGEVKINSSVQGLEDWGEMRAAGFRPGSDKGRKMGVTAVNPRTARSEEALLEDQERMLDLALINENLAEWMASLCMKAFKSNHDLALKYEVPSFSDPTWEKSPNANVFASSAVVTRDGFNNNSHRDHDATAYTYSIFSRINRDTGDLHCVATSDYLGDTVDTYFMLNQYHAELALDLCDGVVESIFASNELHQTSPSTTYNEGWVPIKPNTSPITRFGSSFQINASLLKRIEGLLKLREQKSDVEWEIYKKKVVKCYEQEIEIKMSKLHSPLDTHQSKKKLYG